MILTDIYRSKPDMTWDIGRQLGVRYGDLLLPESLDFDYTNISHWKTLYKKYTDYDIKPIVIEPMPNRLHNHIKAGDAKRDECIDQVISMLKIMNELDIRTICFNWMAYVGWTRTSKDLPERGGAKVTGFKITDYIPTGDVITEEQLWENYSYFLKAVIPEAEKNNINLALHPDDPPLAKLGGVSRIMISARNIDRAIREIYPSPNLGLTFCQATFHTMGENVYELIPKLADKIMFVHFRNVTGSKEDFHETFHDNGELDMAKLMWLYKKHEINVPIRVDHVPTMVGEDIVNAGYDAIGRHFAIGYLKGLIEATEI